MTKTLFIEFAEKDEALLLALFKKLRIKTFHATSHELQMVQSAISEKYEKNGKWEQLSDDEKQDVVLAEMMLIEKQQTDYQLLSTDESTAFLTDLKKQIHAM